MEKSENLIKKMNINVQNEILKIEQQISILQTRLDELINKQLKNLADGDTEREIEKLDTNKRELESKKKELEFTLKNLNREGNKVNESVHQTMPKSSMDLQPFVSSSPKITLLKAKLPNSQTAVEFEEHEVPPDGDCGFNTLSTDRKTLAETLLLLKNDAQACEFLAEEIANAFTTYILTESTAEEEGLVPDDRATWKKLLENRDQAQKQLDALLRKIRDELADFGAKTLPLDQLVTWLQKQNELIQAQTLSDQHLILYKAETALMNHCQKPTVFEYYVNALSDKSSNRPLWLGYKSACLFAKQKNLSLYIWQKDDTIPNQLALIYFYVGKEVAANEIHMLHTHDFTHFNLLAKPQPSENIQPSGNPVETQKSYSDGKQEVTQYRSLPMEGIKISKCLHFIWVGGRYASDKSIKVIATWAAHNPDWKVFLWVDRLSAPGQSEERLRSHYQKIFKKIRGDFDNSSLENIEIKDISSLEDVSTQAYMEVVRHEIDRLDPNYGAASDLLRYLILQLYGGGYFDIDVSCEKTSLTSFKIIQYPNKHKFLIDHIAQKLNKDITLKELQDFKVSRDARIGNDSIITTTSNPIVFKLVEEVVKNYKVENLTALVKLNNPKSLFKIFFCNYTNAH